MIKVVPVYLKARLEVPLTILKTPTALNKNDLNPMKTQAVTAKIYQRFEENDPNP